MVFGTTFSSQNLISETNKGKLILKIDEDFYQFIKDPSNYGEINVDGSQNIKIYPGLGITDICAIDLFIANRSSNMFSDNSHNCLERDLSDIDFISYKCLSENTIYDISLDNSFVEITIEYKANRLNKLNEILTNDISVNRNSSKLKFFNSPKIFNNALKRDDYSKHLIMPELNDEYNIPGRDLSGHFNNLIYYKSSNYEGDISTSLYIHDTSAEILTPVQLLNYKLLEIQEESSKNVFFNTYNWGDYTHPLSGFHLGALAYNNLLYNDLSYDSNEFYNNSGIYIDEQTYRKLTIPHMANKYIKRINDISLSIVKWYQDISLDMLSTGIHNYNYPDMSLVYNSDFNELEKGTSLTNKDKNLLFNIDNSWQYICDVCFTDISLYSQTNTDISDVSYIYHEIKKNFFNIFNEDRIGQPSKLIKWDGSDFSCIKTKLGLSEDSIGRDCEIKIEYYYEEERLYGTYENRKQRQVNYFFKGYDLSSCFGFFNSEYNSKMFGQEEISDTYYDISYLYKTGGDILSEPGLMECTTSLNIDLCNQIHNPDNYDLCGGKMNYKKKYGYTFSNFNNVHELNEKEVVNHVCNNGLWSFYTNNTRYSFYTGAQGYLYISHSILWTKVMDAYRSEDISASDLKIKDILHSSYIKYLKFMDKNFFSFNKWAKLERGHINYNYNHNYHYVDYLFKDKNSSITSRMDVSNISIDDIFEEKGFLSVVVLPSDINNYPSGAITNRSPVPWYNETHTTINGETNNIAYHSIDDYINDISLLIQTGNLPIFNNNSPITKYISGSIHDFFRYIEFINRRLTLNDNNDGIEWYKITSQHNTRHDYINVFPFLVLHYNYNGATSNYELGVTTENHDIKEHRQGTIGGVVPSKKLKVYARKARQDINTKKLLDIKEFDKIPLFLYKDPFVNNHHQFEITSKEIPTIYPALTCDVSSIAEIDITDTRQIYNKKSLEEIYLSVDFTNSTNNLNNRFLSNFKTQLNKNNELLYFAQENKNNPPIKFKIRNSNYDDFSYNFETDNSYSIVNGQYNNYINDLFSYNLPRFQYRPIYESINTNILTILNCNNNPDFSTNFGNKHFENLLAINNNKLPKLNEEKYTYKLIDYSDNNIYNLNKIYEYRVNDLSSYSYFADISLNDDIKTNVLEAFNDISTNIYDMSLINYMNNKNSEKIDNFPLYQNISIKIDKDDYTTNTTSITDGSNYKLDLQLWDVSNMFIDISNKYQIDFSNINCKGLNIFGLIEDISINNDWDYIYSEKILRSRDFSFSFSGSDSILDLSFSINITDLSDSNLSMTNLNYLDFSYNLYELTTNSTISNDSISNHFRLNFNYLTSRDNSENLNYYLNNVKNLNIIDNPDRNLLENYNNNDFNNFNMKMFDFETLHPKIHSNIINDNSKIDICPEAFLNCDLFFENNFNLYDESYNYYKINNTKDTNYLDMSNSRLNISELFEYKMFSSSNLIQDISKSIETFNFTPFTKNFINDISFYFSDNINYIYSNKYSPLNINTVNDLIPNVNLIDNNNKVVYKNTILLPKDASNLFADLNIDKINSLMNFTKTDNCDKMFKNTLSLYDNRLLKFSAFNNLNNDISLNEMFMNSSINFFPYLLINSLKDCSNTSKIEAKDIITNCNNIYLNEYFLAIKSFSEVLDFNNNFKYTNNDLSNVEISWNLTNNKYFGGDYPSTFEKTIMYSVNDQHEIIKIDKIFIESLDSEKGIYWDYYLNTGVNYQYDQFGNINYYNKLNCINKLDVNNIPNHGNIPNDTATHRLLTSPDWQGYIVTGDLSLNIYKTSEYTRFHFLDEKELYWSIGFLLKILGFTDLSNQTHYNKPISLNSKYEQRRKFLKEKMYKHNNTDQILDWYGVDDRYCGQFDDTSMSSYINYDYSLNVINLFYLFPETSYCWLDLSINLSYRDIYYEDHFVNKIVKPNKTLNIYKNDPFYKTDIAYDYPSKIILSNDFFYLSWLEKYAINTLNKGLNYNDSPVFRYIYVNSFSTYILRTKKYPYMMNNNEIDGSNITTQISDIMINVKVNDSDQSFVLIDNSICELFNLSFGNMFYDNVHNEPWFNDGSGIYTSIGNVYHYSDNTNNPGTESKKFPFYHITANDISDSNSNNLKNARLDRLQITDRYYDDTTTPRPDQNYNFWLKIDLGFILNKLYPNDFTSHSIPLDRINYIYFYENQLSDNLTYILSNINYSSSLEEPEKNLHSSHKNNLLEPGFISRRQPTHGSQFGIYSPYGGVDHYMPDIGSVFSNDINAYTRNNAIVGDVSPIASFGGDKSDTLLYYYKVFNCNEFNLFTYTNGFTKDFNQSLSSSSSFHHWEDIFSDPNDLFRLTAQLPATIDNSSLIPDTYEYGKNGILIKGNTDFNDVKIYTEISNNIASFSNLKNNNNNNNNNYILSNSTHVSDHTIRFDYIPYQNRNEYETREIKNYFIENYYNLIRKSIVYW